MREIERNDAGPEGGVDRTGPRFDIYKSNLGASQNVATLGPPCFADVSDWIEKIKGEWSRGAGSTIQLARLVWAARKRLHRGQWTRLWQSGGLPFSKRKGEMLAVIGKNLGWVNAQTFAHLPWGWSILYHLARLDRKTFEHLVKESAIHAKLTLQEAKHLVEKLKGQPGTNNSRINVKQRLQRFADFVLSTAHDWRPEERELAKALLAELIQEIHSKGCAGLADALRGGRSGSLLRAAIGPCPPPAIACLDPTNNCMKTCSRPVSVSSLLSKPLYAL